MIKLSSRLIDDYRTIFLRIAILRKPNDWFNNERGNVWLTNGEGDHVAWFDLPGTKQRLEITIALGNYPGFLIAVLSEGLSRDESLAAHINSKLGGWIVRKCNIEGVHIDPRTHEILDPDDTDCEEDDDA